MANNILKIKQEIDKNDIVSFDIFDTLLLRNVCHPTDIFRILAAEVEERQEINNFFEIRVNSEIEARKLVKNQEANYNEIYEIIQEKCSFPVDWIKQYELELEYKFITDNPFMKQVYDYAKETGKNIYFISDMYLPVEFIAKLLEKCGYDAKNLFISYEYRENKGLTGLYDIVRNRFDLNKEKWIHFGDNRVSDYEKALEYGIHAYWYKNVSTYREWKKPLTIGESIIAGIQNNQLYNGCDIDYWTEYGMKYASPIYYGFAKWLYRLTCKEDNMYFFARDGWAIKKVYDMFCEKESNDIFTDYLYCSRKVLQLPAMAGKESMNKAVRELTNRAGFKDHVPTLREVLEMAYISDWDTAALIAPAFGFESLDVLVEEERHGMAVKMVARLSENMRKNLLGEKAISIAYLKQEGVDRWDNVNVMDIGWKGSCQDALENLLQKKATGYYFGTVADINPDKYCNMFGWYFDCGVPIENQSKTFNCIMMWEMMFSAPHGSVIGYQKNELGKICPILNNDKKYNDVVKQFQNAAFFLCRRYMEYDSYMDLVSPSFCTEQFQDFLESKRETDLQMFRNLYNDFMIGSAKMHSYVATITDDDFNSANLEKIRRKIDTALWREAFLWDVHGININKKNVIEYKLLYPQYDHIKYLENNLQYAKIYFDFGEGFNENDSIIVPMKKQRNHYSFRLDKEFIARQMRIDPIEGHIIEVKEVTVRVNGKECCMVIPKKSFLSHNGYKKIQTEDPYFVMESLPERIANIEFEADIRLCD